MSKQQKRDDGEPAFPCKRTETLRTEYNHRGNSVPVVTEVEYPGMKLRDYFAAEAMAAVFQSEWTNDSPQNYGDIARRAGLMADAMLKERAQ